MRIIPNYSNNNSTIVFDDNECDCLYPQEFFRLKFYFIPLTSLYYIIRHHTYVRYNYQQLYKILQF